MLQCTIFSVILHRINKSVYMSLILPDGLPAIKSLKEENIFIENCTQTEDRSTRKLRIALLNIMPIKETTEMDFARVLSYSPLNIELTLMKLRTHTPKHASPEHMERFDELKDEKFDGFIVTGAPISILSLRTLVTGRSFRRYSFGQTPT